MCGWIIDGKDGKDIDYAVGDDNRDQTVTAVIYKGIDKTDGDRKQDLNNGI